VSKKCKLKRAKALSSYTRYRCVGPGANPGVQAVSPQVTITKSSTRR